MRKEDLSFDVRKYPVKDTEQVAWIQTVDSAFRGQIDLVAFPDAIGSIGRSGHDAKSKVTNAMKQSYGTSYITLYDTSRYISFGSFDEIREDTAYVDEANRDKVGEYAVYVNGLQIVGFILKETKIPDDIVKLKKQYLDLATKFNKNKKNFSDADLATLQEVDAKLEEYFNKGK